MCGIAGFTFAAGLGAAEREEHHAVPLRRMTAALRHRGPDAQRALLLDGVALGHARLAIVDPLRGKQPMRDPATGVTVVFNGEIFNHLELRALLKSRYRFRTHSDTEVLIAAYLDQGIECLRALNGQFAFALWDPRTRALWLARDRMGIAPLYLAQTPQGLVFASECKAIFASGRVAPALDLRALKQSLQLWSPVAPRSAFDGIQSLQPGMAACFRNGSLRLHRYWQLDLSAPVAAQASEDEAAEELGALLEDAVRLRLRADVPIAAYLSGGLDSSLLCALANAQLRGSLSTFSVNFGESSHDERHHQATVVHALRTAHASVQLSLREIGELLPTMVWHAEQVSLRSAPAPLLRLSRLVREHGTKVVLTGEGADEILLGYDLFKEAQVRAFWARAPDSRLRPRLLARLHPWLPHGTQPLPLLKQLYALGPVDDPAFSHRTRWTAGTRLLRFLSREVASAVEGEDPTASLLETLPSAFRDWPPLARAQYLECQTFLSGYLLSVQGDRMLLANGVEGRFPYLDHRIIELAARLPATFKLRGLREKRLLRRIARGKVPDAILARHKFPYRAPIAPVLFGPWAPGWTRELLSTEAIRRIGIFDAERVGRLLAKCRAHPSGTSESEDLALMAVASTQLLAFQFTRVGAISHRALEQVEVEAA